MQTNKALKGGTQCYTKTGWESPPKDLRGHQHLMQREQASTEVSVHLAA